MARIANGSLGHNAHNVRQVKNQEYSMLKLYLSFKVISDESRLEKISLVANPETEAFSTNVIYEFEVGPEGNKTLADHASSFYRFRRLGNPNIKFRIA